ncbi:MAG: glutathione binding-like protein, partial [Pseudomonadota bacterium]
AEKFGAFLPTEHRARTECLNWLFWQMGGLGPMAGQAHHFRQYASDEVPYAIKRYTDEVNRLYGVMDRRLGDVSHLAGEDYSVADMAAFPWVRSYERQGQDLAEFPNLEAWFNRISSRPATERAVAVGVEERAKFDLANDSDAQSVLFGQRAAS